MIKRVEDRKARKAYARMVIKALPEHDQTDLLLELMGLTCQDIEDLAALRAEQVAAMPVDPPPSDDDLHARCEHPDYEYETTIAPRKSDDTPVPYGDGWEPNLSLGHGRGWERFDYIEESYWMRRKQAKP